VVKPCNPKRSFPFTETRQPDRAAGPMHSKPFIGGRYSSFDVPQRPWPSLRRYCCPGHRRVAIISGPTGSRRCCLRYGTLLKRGPGVRSSWSRSGSSNGLPRPGVARELPFKSHFKGEAKPFHLSSMPRHTGPTGCAREAVQGRDIRQSTTRNGMAHGSSSRTHFFRRLGCRSAATT
jgi:hypothetical protein